MSEELSEASGVAGEASHVAARAQLHTMRPHTAGDYPPRDPQLFYELAKERLATQLGFIDANDNKIGLLVSLASALMGLVAAVFALRAQSLGAAEIATLAASALAYVAVALGGIQAYFSRSWDIGPDLEQIWNKLWDQDKEDQLIKWTVANDFWDYYKRNLPAQHAKANALPWVLGGVIIQSVILVLALSLVAAGV